MSEETETAKFETFDQQQIEKIIGMVIERMADNAPTRDDVQEMIEAADPGISIEGPRVSGGGRHYVIGDTPVAPETFLIPATTVVAPKKRWQIKKVSNTPPTISLSPNGGRIGKTLHGEHLLALENPTATFEISAGDRFYLEFVGAIDTEFEVTLKCGQTEWATEEPFLVDSNGDIVYTEFYYPIGVVIAYDATLVADAELIFGENLMVMNLAPDSNLTLVEGSYIRYEDNNKAYYVAYPYPPAGPFVFAPAV